MLRPFAVLALVLLASPAAAQDNWPSKPITVIVPFGAGGNTDALARIYSARLSARLGQPFVVERVLVQDQRPKVVVGNGLHGAGAAAEGVGKPQAAVAGVGVEVDDQHVNMVEAAHAIALAVSMDRPGQGQPQKLAVELSDTHDA